MKPPFGPGCQPPVPSNERKRDVRVNEVLAVGRVRAADARQMPDDPADGVAVARHVRLRHAPGGRVEHGNDGRVLVQRRRRLRRDGGCEGLHLTIEKLAVEREIFRRRARVGHADRNRTLPRRLDAREILQSWARPGRSIRKRRTVGCRARHAGALRARPRAFLLWHPGAARRAADTAASRHLCSRCRSRPLVSAIANRLSQGRPIFGSSRPARWLRRSGLARFDPFAARTSDKRANHCDDDHPSPTRPNHVSPLEKAAIEARA